jgi:hypothetical protein
MEEYSRFSLKDHTFIAFGPSGDGEPREWTLQVNKDEYVNNQHKSTLIKEVKIPIIHRPIFGYDVNDLELLNEKVEELIKELKLEE